MNPKAIGNLELFVSEDANYQIGLYHQYKTDESARQLRLYRVGLQWEENITDNDILEYTVERRKDFYALAFCECTAVSQAICGAGGMGIADETKYTIEYVERIPFLLRGWGRSEF